ncbi:MAG: PLP-dependent aminotransferase family protein [Christensenellales bacterium]|jgi:2-aminoadipate transaminase
MRMTDAIIAEHMKPITGSAIRDVFKLMAKPGMISFAGGNPSDSALEPDVVGEVARDMLAEHGTKLLQYGGTEGLYSLRESTAEFLKTCGVSAAADEVLPAQGSTQAFDLLLKAVINPGDTILVESPTFLGALQAMRVYRANIVSIPTDENGVIPEAAEELIKRHAPKMMYIIPTFQNPTGITLSRDRRPKLAELANRYGVILAEDDPYRDLRYAGDPLPAIKSYDENGWVVYLSSYSKLISPGMRVGAAVVSNEMLLRKMIIGKQSADVHSPLLNQAIVDAYIRRGLLKPHIARICESYKTQLDAMLRALDGFPAGTTHTTPEGGLFVWAQLPAEMSARALLTRAIEKNVAFVPGTFFYHAGGHDNTLRLNFSNAEVPQIEIGMAALADAIKEG